MAEIIETSHAGTDRMLEVYERFVGLETRIAAHRLTIGGVHVWSAARSEIFRKVLTATATTTDFHNIDLAYGGGRARLLKNLALRNPFLAGRADTVIFRWERRHGTEGDPISNAVASSLGGQERLIQIEARGNPAEGPGRYSIDAVAILAKLVARRLDLRPTEAERKAMAAAEAAVRDEFGVDVALLGFLSAYAVRFESRARVFTQLFRRLGTRRVFIVVAYSFPDIIEGAHRAGAHVVELQHGLMFRSHTGYDFPDSQDVQYRPDEIWLFGDHWRTAARHDPRTKLTVFGAPHIRARIAAAANRTGDRHGLIVLSQPAVTGQLSRFAIELASLPGTPHILYRLHPNESPDAVREAARLSGLGPDRFEVSIGGGGTRTMELQAAHRYQLGVFSTAVVEGLALGCETMILGIPGWSALQSLVDDGLAKLVVTPEQAAAAMTGPPSAAAVVEADRFFA